VLLHAVPPRLKDADRQHNRREHGQEVNRAPTLGSRLSGSRKTGGGPKIMTARKGRESSGY
jgi:hypothetical protein